MPSISDFVWASFISSANERASSARFSQYSTSRNSDGGVGTAQLRVLLSSSLRSFWFEINKRTKDDPVSKHIAVQKACRFGARNFHHGIFFLIARNRSQEFYKKFAKCLPSERASERILGLRGGLHEQTNKCSQRSK